MGLWLFTLILSVLVALWLILLVAVEPLKTASVAFKSALSGGILLVPLGAMVLYDGLGNPHLPARPFERTVMAATPQNLDVKLVQTQVLSSRNPYDANILEDLAALYMAAGYYRDASLTYRRLIAQHGQTAERAAQLDAALMAVQDGGRRITALNFIAANIALIEGKISQNRQDAQAWAMLVRAHHAVGNEAEYRATCARAVLALAGAAAANLPLCPTKEAVQDNGK